MPPDPAEPTGPLTVDRRRAVFAALVKSQDDGESVAASRTTVGQRFRVTENQVKAIEREGVEKGWPPL